MFHHDMHLNPDTQEQVMTNSGNTLGMDNGVSPEIALNMYSLCRCYSGAACVGFIFKCVFL